jgi:hypothetical protein
MKVLYVLCLLCGLQPTAVALDREAFTFTRYDLDVRVEPEQQRLGVRGKITLRNDSDASQKSLVLQISSTLNWRSIQIEGKPAEFVAQTYTSDVDHTGALTEAIVTLPYPVAPKQTISLEIGYEGIIPQDTTRLARIGVPADVAKHSDWDQIGRSFTAVRGVGYVAWYPIATEAASLSESNSVAEAVGRWKQREAASEMRVKFSQLADTSEGQRVVFCGRESHSERNSNAGTPECAFRDLNSEVPFFVTEEFHTLDHPAADIFYLSDHKSQAENYALAVDEVAPFIENWFGDHRETPGLKAEVIELPDATAAPFESGTALLTPLSGNENADLLSAVQQLTYIAFPSPRAWIHDGLARYAQVNFLQEKEGRDAAIEYLRNHRQSLIESEKLASAETDQAARSLINADDEFYIQSKAMNVWWMLRDIVGDTALSAALHNYKSEDDKTPAYIQKLIEAQAHRDLEWFFDDWVYRDRGLPEFHVVSVYPRELLNGGYMVTVTVENSGQAGAEVPVTLKMANGERSERMVVPAKSSASVRIACPSFPEQAIVNDGSVSESDVSNNVYKIESSAH